MENLQRASDLETSSPVSSTSEESEQLKLGVYVINIYPQNTESRTQHTRVERSVYTIWMIGPKYYKLLHMPSLRFVRLKKEYCKKLEIIKAREHDNERVINFIENTLQYRNKQPSPALINLLDDLRSGSTLLVPW